MRSAVVTVNAKPPTAGYSTVEEPGERASRAEPKAIKSHVEKPESRSKRRKPVNPEKQELQHQNGRKNTSQEHRVSEFGASNRPRDVLKGEIGRQTLKKRHINLLLNECSSASSKSGPDKRLAMRPLRVSIDACCCIYEVKEKKGETFRFDPSTSRKKTSESGDFRRGPR
ncbi:hypothetical protein NA56DRAFT_655968 [Hyaloscypha hepaticicola]|uniref:Uncharacterized protein n=1 Tax=Hyaloscypha hepaticicola TaxID=2082293 RepID=A0A2J6QFF5_9HELO|nr:hypothetical protein NA56DRAFT_655968 [Hyaloscypha hepaticicola]